MRGPMSTAVSRIPKLWRSNAIFKGTVSRDFLLQVFFINQFPPAPEYPIWTVSNFSKIRGDIRRSRLTTGVADTGGQP